MIQINRSQFGLGEFFQKFFYFQKLDLQVLAAIPLEISEDFSIWI